MSKHATIEILNELKHSVERLKRLDRMNNLEKQKEGIEGLKFKRIENFCVP